MEPKEMLELVDKHAAAEVARDLEAVMATVGKHPVYDFYPGNLHVEGRDAVRKLYEAVCAIGLPPFTRLGTWTNESSVVSEDVIQVEGADIRTMSIFSFDDDGLLAGEAVFASEPIGGNAAAAVFDNATQSPSTDPENTRNSSVSKWEIHEDLAAKAAYALSHDPRGMRAITTPDTQIWHSYDGVWRSFHETLDSTGALYTSLKAENRAPRFEAVGAQATTTGALVQAMVTGMSDVPMHIVVVLTIEDGVVTNLLEYSGPSAVPIPDPRFVEITSSVTR